MTRRHFKQHTNLLAEIMPSVAVLFIFLATAIAVAQSQGCSNADGNQYAEGSRLGPFKCQGGQWIYVGE